MKIYQYLKSKKVKETHDYTPCGKLQWVNFSEGINYEENKQTVLTVS